MGGIVSSIGDALGGAVDTVGGVFGGAVDTVGNTLDKIVSNPLPAVTAYATGNPTSLLAYTQGSGGGGTSSSSSPTSSSLIPNYFSSGGGGGGYSPQPIVINNTMPQATNNNSGMWASLIPALLQGTGGLLQQQTSKESAQKAASTMLDAGRLAQQQAAFRPVGMTTNFGSSNFQVDPTTGQITQAGYSLSPQLQAAQEGILGGLRQNLTDAQTQAALGRGYLGSNYGQPVQNLGSQYMGSNVGSPLTQAGLGYLKQSPEQAAAKWMQGQQALLQPGREQAWAKLNQGNYNQGTTGLKVAQGGNLHAANPYASALANAQAQQDLSLAAQAQQQGLAQQQAGAGLYSQGQGLTQAQQLAGAGLYGAGQGLTQQGQVFGQGLLSSAYAPVNAGLTTAGGLEQLGQSPFTLASQLGQYGSQAGANAGKLGLTGSMGAAEAYLKPEYQLNPLSKALSGIGQSSVAQGLFGQVFGGGNTGVSSSNPLGNLGSWDLSNLGSIFANNSAMSSTPNYLDAAGQLPSLDYSNFVWG